MHGISVGVGIGIGRKRPLAERCSATAISTGNDAKSPSALHTRRIHVDNGIRARATLRYLIPTLSVLVVLLQSAVFMTRQEDIPVDHRSNENHAAVTQQMSALQAWGKGSRRRKLSDGFDEPNRVLGSTTDTVSAASSSSLFPQSMNKLVTDMAVIPRRQFADAFDVGYALDKKQEGNEKVLLLYANRTTSNGTQAQTRSSTSFQSISVDDAKKQCKTIKVILTDPEPKKQECIAIMGQWSSYHVHKFKRRKKKKKKTDEGLGADASEEITAEPDESQYEWKYAPGRKMMLPTADQQEANRRILLMYLSSYPDALERLKPIANLASRGGSKDGEKMPITVLLSNYGQSRFLLNYICAARARNIDVSRVLLFAMDEETYKLGQSMGLAVFYDEKIFGFFPKDAAKNYHDISYALIMMTKVFSVHLVNALGHDLLFSDVDIGLYKDPIPYFLQQPAEYDAFFQHDGYHHPTRFAPLAANTGFYYVRNNERTRFFFSLFVRMGDYVIMERSHQAALTTLVNEQMSLHGLRVKIMGKEHKTFMSGYHYHSDKKLVRKLKEGRHNPYLFHANWLPGDEKMPVLMETKNWFVQEKCIDKSFDELKSSVDSIEYDCCKAEPAPYDPPTKEEDEAEQMLQRILKGEGE